MSTTPELGLKNDHTASGLLSYAWVNQVADDLDDASANHLSASIAVGAEAANVIQVTVQAKTNGGTNLATETPITAWLVDSNSKTAAVTGTAPNSGWAAGVGRLLRSYTANKDAAWISNSSGVVRIDITHSSTGTWYLVVQIGARLYISGAITFA